MKKFILAAMIVILALSVTLFSLLPKDAAPSPADPSAAEIAARDDKSVSVSVPSGFLSRETTVTLSCEDENATIRYTLDGSEPTAESRPYDAPIVLTPVGGGKTTGLTVRAAAFADGGRGETVTAAYILDSDISARFDTLVFSLTTDPYNLYDYEYGIFVEGKIRDDYRKDHPFVQPDSPANFNLRGMESERPVYVEVFEPDGTRVIAQNAGMRVAGGWSRAEKQKSVRLIARSEYGQGKFRYDFFPREHASDGYLSPITSYDTVILRNGANDRDFGMLREEMIYALSEDAGWDTVSPARPAAVFLNGEYYGFVWVHVSMNEHWLADKYGGNSDDYEIYGNGELWTDSEEGEEALAPFMAFSWRDFNDPKTLEEFEQLVDLDNLLTYYAMEVYAGNRDWPGNNMKRWRYTGDPERAENKWQDGRWRYALFDAEMSFGLYGAPYLYNHNTLGDILGGNQGQTSQLMIALLKNKTVLAQFAQKICALGTPFGQSPVSAAIDTLFASAQNEITHALDARKYSDWVSIGGVIDNHGQIRDFAARRFDYMTGEVARRFSLDGGTYRLALKNGRAAGIVTSGGLFYSELPLTLTPELPPGETGKFSHWIINGERVDTETVTLSGRSAAVTAEAVFAPKTLVFADLGAEVCVLGNVSDAAIDLSGLYISDKPGNLKRWSLPSVILAPGETLDLKDGEIMPPSFGYYQSLIISDEDTNILDIGSVIYGR